MKTVNIASIDLNLLVVFDALLAEGHQLNFSADDILRMVRERQAAMDPEADAEPSEVKK